MARTATLLFCLHLFNCSVALAQQRGTTSGAATLAEAKAILDLSVFPLVDPLGEPKTRNVASQAYVANGSVESVMSKLQQELAKSGFKPEGDTTIAPDFALGIFKQNGFVVSLFVAPGREPTPVTVTINNHGNVDLDKLPLPENAQKIYSTPNFARYTIPTPAETAKAECIKSLKADGWEWFGDTTVSFFVRKNAVRLQIVVSPDSDQNDKSSLHITSELLSAVIPVPQDLAALQYSDINGGTIMDSKLSPRDFIESLRSAMTASGWEATTEQPVKVGSHDRLIFRSPTKELADCEIFEFEGMTRCRLEYMTGAQVDAESEAAAKYAKEMQAKKEADGKPATVITFPNIASAKLSRESETSVEFETKSQQANKLLSVWLKARVAEGWKQETLVEAKEASEYTLTKDQLTVRVSILDPGFIPGKITLTADGKSGVLKIKKD